MEGLEVYADVVRRARLDAEGFEPARDLALQSLAGIDDDPRQKLLIKLRECHWPWPFGRNAMGETPDLEALTPDEARADYQSRYTPANAILAVAGDIDLDRLKDQVEGLFGDWAAPAPKPVEAASTGSKRHFEKQDTEQTHIGLAYSAVSESHPEYYAARLAIEALAGGMSGRLFTEIREKKGLVYSVSANYASLPNLAAVMGYAGTSNERAQQTLDQFIFELRRLSDGITADELSRAKIGLKASTIMSNESSSSRAGALAQDYLLRGQIRTMQQILAAIDGVTLDDVNAYLAGNRASNFTLVIVGPKELEMPA
jgi:predicted Zn-dependent peptidase